MYEMVFCKLFCFALLLLCVGVGLVGLIWIGLSPLGGVFASPSLCACVCVCVSIYMCTPGSVLCVCFV